MTSKKKIVLVFDSLFAFRSYSESGVHLDLSSEFETSFLLVDNNSNHISEIKSTTSAITTIKLNRASQAILSFLATVYWQRKSRASNSFRVRISSLLIGRRLFYSEPKRVTPRLFSIKTLLGVALGNMNFRPPKFLYQIAGMPLRKHLKNERPGLIIYITLGGGIGLSDLLKVISDSISTKTFVLMDNWDNIYSKAVFNFAPFRLGVWNARAMEFASNVHRIPRENIIILPSSRVNHLIDQFNEELPTPSYVLFAGGSMQISFDARWLRILHQEMQSINPYLHIKYLPHPINYRNLPEISSCLLSLDIHLAWNASAHGEKVLPPLSLYPQLFRGSLCVVSPLSTVSLEAALLGIDSIGVDFFDNFEGKTCSAFETFEHYWDLESYDNFYLVQTQNELRELLQQHRILENDKSQVKSQKYNSYKEDFFRVIRHLVLS